MSDKKDVTGTFQNVRSVLNQFHDSGVLDLDKSARELMAPAQALAQLQPGGEVGAAIIAWDGYGLVIKSAVANAVDLQGVAKQLRQSSVEQG